MKKVIKFVKGKRDDKKDTGITPSNSAELLSPAQTPEDERFLGLENARGYYVDFCGKDKTLTKLHKAAWQGNSEKVKSALKKIDIDSVDRHNRTPLHFAVAQGHRDVVWYLLANNARNCICDSEGRTPLLKAVECGYKECMNLLLERGANINHADFAGTTCLHIVCSQGALEVATCLLEKGADIEVPNNSGEYPLHIATRTQNKDMVQLLLRNGASVNSVDRDNRTPLMLAAKTGNIIFTQLFYENGAELNVVDSNGWAAEDYALLGGHQNVVTELRNLVKKENKPTLEPHAEEDEAESWNDSHLSDPREPRPEGSKVGQFMRKFSVESEVRSEKDDDAIDSPGTGIVPPPCRPPRSWEIIEAGMIDEALVNGAEPKRRSITALGSLLSRRESFTDNSGTQSDSAKYTLSLNRRKEPKKSIDVKQRYSYHEDDSVKRPLTDDFQFLGKNTDEDGQNIMRIKRREQKERKSKSNSGSDWDSNLSSLLETEPSHSNKVSDADHSTKKDEKEDFADGTLGRKETMNEINEIWINSAKPSIADIPPPKLPEKVEEETEVSSSWDSGDSIHNEVVFPPPPTPFELGVDMAKSISYMKGISIDHTPNFSDEQKEWGKSFEPPQAHSLDFLEEKGNNEFDIDSDKSASSKRHLRNPSIVNQKWLSVELPPQHRPSNRSMDVNRRINEQLECYDQALRELDECSYNREDIVMSKRASTKSSQVENYYSLPSAKCKPEGGLVQAKPLQTRIDYGMSLPLQFRRKPDFLHGANYDKALELNNGPSSLPYSTNFQSPNLAEGLAEVENNEELGFEEAPDKERSKGKALENAENYSEISENEKGDKKSKRHMLLTMRDVKHAVQVTNSFKTSLDEHILSPLTKVEGVFHVGLSTSNESEELNDPEERVFNRGDSEGLIERQETVIERLEFRTKSTSSESGDEPTLWLQDTSTKAVKPTEGSGDRSAGSEVKCDPSFSPLGVVYQEIQAERLSKSRTSSPETSRASNQMSPLAAFKRFQRLDSSSDNDVDEKTTHDDGSPDISFSSGPIEPLGKDSGSEPESSHQDFTPVHRSTLKKHQKWLKDRLQSENKERYQLEEVAAQLAEKAERLQYELADAKEATKSRDEIISLLQSQLERMEASYTKSLEESVHCRLQLTALEQEILHLKELCGQYEDERESRLTDGKDKYSSDMLTKIRHLEEEREGLSKVIIRLEKENRILEKCIREGRHEEALEDKQRWKERCQESIQPAVNCQSQTRDVLNVDNMLQLRNAQLESEIKVLSRLNQQLESKLENLLAARELSNHEDISESILLLNKKNTELENQLKILIEELDMKKIVRAGKEESLVDKLNREKKSKECSTDHKTREVYNEDKVSCMMKENERLTETVASMEKEITRLKSGQNEKLNFRLNKEDEILSEKEMAASNEEISEVNPCSQELQKEYFTRSGPEIYQTSNMAQTQNSKNDLCREGGVSRIVRKDELAWGNLYGMKHVPNSRTPKHAEPTACEKDSEEVIELKMKLLEQELEKTKESMIRQQLETSLRIQNIPLLAQNTKVLELQKKVTTLESEIETNNDFKCSLQKKNFELGLESKEKRKLEFELENLKSRILREFVPKWEVEADKMKSNLLETAMSANGEVMDEQLKKRCSILAQERERANNLRRRLGRHSSSWEDRSEPFHPKNTSLRDIPRAKTAMILSKSSKDLDRDTRNDLTNLLEGSIKRYGLDLPEDGEITCLRLELLKKKHLC